MPILVNLGYTYFAPDVMLESRATNLLIFLGNGFELSCPIAPLGLLFKTLTQTDLYQIALSAGSATTNGYTALKGI
jgi:hypothetical protein